MRVIFPCVVRKATAHIETNTLNMRHQAQKVFCGIFVEIPEHQKGYFFCTYPLQDVNGVIADKSVVTKIMSNSIGFQHIGFNGFAKHHWQTGYYPVAYDWCLCLC